MNANRVKLLPLAALALLLAVPPAAAAPRKATKPAPARLHHEDAAPSQEAAASGWTHVGCLQLRPWTACNDVFQDASGNYWMCSACGKTKNPSPGKCRQLASLDGTWCGATQ